MRSVRLVFPFLALAVAGLFAGCTTTQTTKAAAEKPKAASTEEYVEVPSTGSWLPRKVKKKRDVIGDSSQTAEADALQKVQDLGKSNVARETR